MFGWTLKTADRRLQQTRFNMLVAKLLAMPADFKGPKISFYLWVMRSLINKIACACLYFKAEASQALWLRGITLELKLSILCTIHAPKSYMLDVMVRLGCISYHQDGHEGTLQESTEHITPVMFVIWHPWQSCIHWCSYQEKLDCGPQQPCPLSL